MYEGAMRIVHESLDPWKIEFVSLFLVVVFVRNLTLRTVSQVRDDSIRYRYFWGSNHPKASQRRALVNSYIFNSIKEVSWYHLSRLTKRTEGQ